MLKNATCAETVVWLKKKIGLSEGLNSKLKHRKAQNSILPRKFGDPYGRPRYLCISVMHDIPCTSPTDFHWFNFFYSFCLVYIKLVCPFLLKN